jgi:dienelactone hydrolase
VRKLRVQFIHGLEGNPQGTKARTLAAHFDAATPAMDTSDFEACVALHAEKLRRFEPDVLVGSSFGGAVAVALLQREHWRGPTLLLAQAALRQGLRARLPGGVPVWLVHATADDVVPIADSRKLARSGTPELVRLIEVEDDHALHAFTTSGALVRAVEDIASADAAPERPTVGRFERFVAPFFEEPTLWPVLVVLVAHALLIGGVVLAFGVRDRNPFALASLALMLVGTVDMGVRQVRARRFGRIGWGLAGFWIGSAVAALLASRFHVF